MKQPNILFIQTDQQKAKSLDLYSDINSISTTNLKMLAENGVVFENSYCPYPLCVPSRISMLTGEYPSSSGYLGNAPTMYDSYGDETIFSAAKKHGYHTMLVGKDHAYGSNCPPDSLSGEDENYPDFLGDIFDRMHFAWHGNTMTPETNKELPHIEPWIQYQDELEKLWGSEVAPWDSNESVSSLLSDKAVEFMKDWQNGSEDKPFAMWLSYPDPHERYQAPTDVVEMINKEDIELPLNWESDINNRSEYIQFMHWYFNKGGVPESKVKKLIRVYLGMCLNVEIQLGKVFDCLKEMGEWENTIIFYVSDHGDFNGEHQLIQKFNCGYDGCTHIPMIVAWPGHSKDGRHCLEPVNLTDIPATICELLGWEKFSQDQGQSFADILLEETYEERKYTVVESGIPSESLTTKDVKNFPKHRYDRKTEGRWCYDPPHRFGGRMYVVRSKDYKLIVRQDKKSEFYNMKDDPWETKNIFGKPKYQKEIINHFEYLVHHLGRVSYKQEDTFIAPQDNIYEAGGDKTWQEYLQQNKNEG